MDKLPAVWFRIDFLRTCINDINGPMEWCFPFSLLKAFDECIKKTKWSRNFTYLYYLYLSSIDFNNLSEYECCEIFTSFCCFDMPWKCDKTSMVCSIDFDTLLDSQKLATLPLKIGYIPKWKDHLSSVQSQVLCHVSFRECIIPFASTSAPWKINMEHNNGVWKRIFLWKWVSFRWTVLF